MTFGQLNSLPNEKILNPFKLKDIADDNVSVTQKLNFNLEKVENIVGKKRKCWLPAFSPLPTMFSKCFFLGVGKSRDCVAKC